MIQRDSTNKLERPVIEGPNIETPSIEKYFELTNREVTADAITVAVTVYNYARYLPECLNSVHAQLHEPLELVVVDDCSSDDSLVFAHKWLLDNNSRFGKVSLWKHEKNSGAAASKNSAFSKVRTDFVMLLDADNVLYPRAISRLHYALTQGNFAAAYSQLEKFGDVQGVGDADLWNPEYFKGGNYVDGMALYSTEAWRTIGGFDSVLNGWEDYDFWCKFIEHGRSAIFVPELLCRYRVHSNSVTSMARRNLVTLWDAMKERHPWL